MTEGACIYVVGQIENQLKVGMTTNMIAAKPNLAGDELAAARAEGSKIQQP